MNEYLSYLEIAQTLNISESTLRRRLKKLPNTTLSTLSKIDKGKVYLHGSILSTLSTLSAIETPINLANHGNNESEKSEIEKSEIQYLRQQNDIFLNTINEKDQQIKNLTSLIVKLQNDINTYIKLLPEKNKEDRNILDIVLKVILIISIIFLVFYLIFG